jgi:hypothetical protein
LLREVLSAVHRANDRGELQKVQVFGAQERCCLEEGNDPLKQVDTLPNNQHQRGVSRSAVVLHDASASKSVLQQIENLPPLTVLADVELRYELPSNSRTWVPLDGYVEGTFSIDKAR